MFLKPHRVKSQTQLKSSERKKFWLEVLKNFPQLTEDELTSAYPNKANVIFSKVICNKGDHVYLYQVQDDPVFFKLDKEVQLYPSVYFLWKFPTIIKTFTTHEPVIKKFLQGADLMLPGIEIHGQATPYSYGGVFPKATMVCINTLDNQCPVAIGKTAHSSMDMYMSGRQGKGVIILHVFEDNLWAAGSKSVPPSLGEVTQFKKTQQSSPLAETDQSSLNGSCSINLVTADIDNLKCDDDESSIFESNDELNDDLIAEEGSQSGPETMDYLLVHCFIKAWKSTAKKIELPILTSTFYRIHMIPACPDRETLDMKKSSFKKLSKFLGEMKNRNYINLREHPKGIENITEVNFAHQDFKNFIVDETETVPKLDNSKKDDTFHPPTFEEVYQVSGTTTKFFLANKFSKGAVLSRQEVREVVTDYIKKKNLSKNNTVEVEPILHDAIIGPKEGFKEFLRWDEIFSRMLGKMSPAFRICYPGRPPIIRKGKIPPIEIATAKRSGNKKVTLIYNVDVFGIDESTFAHQIQVGVAASTSVGPAEHKPQGTTQVMVQGNQVNFIAKLLLDTYNIPRKFIKGLELAQKAKKK